MTLGTCELGGYYKCADRRIIFWTWIMGCRRRFRWNTGASELACRIQELFTPMNNWLLLYLLNYDITFTCIVNYATMQVG